MFGKLVNVAVSLYTVSLLVNGEGAAVYTLSAEAAKVAVISVNPGPVITICPDDECTVATLKSLLTKLTTPVPCFVIKGAIENELLVVRRSVISAKLKVGVIGNGT